MKHLAQTLTCVALLSIASQQSQASVIYSEDFESGTAPGWTLLPFFETRGFGLWHVTENAPASGRFALGYVENETPGPTPNGDYAPLPPGLAGNAGEAVSPAILLPSGPVALYFDVLADINDDKIAFDRLILNGTYGVIDENGIHSIGESLASTSFVDGGKVAIPVNAGYTRIGIDISPSAGHLFALDFVFNTFDGLENNGAGIRIDNIEIDTGPVIPEPSTFVLSSILLGVFGAARLARSPRLLRRRTAKHLALTLTCVALLSIASQQSQAGVIYSEGFESGDAPGWLLDGFWHVTENAPASGRFALGYVKDETPGPIPNGDYDTGIFGNSGIATAPTILLPQGAATLSFDAFVDVTPSPLLGSDRFQVFPDLASNFDTIPGGSYVHVVIDISSFINVGAPFTPFTWGFLFFTGDEFFNDTTGIRIDNIEIDSAFPEPSTFVLSSILLGVFGAARLARLPRLLGRRTAKHLAQTLTCVALLSIASQQSQAGVIYSEGFESGDAPGWTFEGGPFSPLWHVTENAPESGRFALGYVQDETPGPIPNGNYDGDIGNNGWAFSPTIMLPKGPATLYFDALLDVDVFASLFLADFFAVLPDHDVNPFFGTDILAANAPTFNFEPGLDGPLILSDGMYHRIAIDISEFAGGPFSWNSISTRSTHFLMTVRESELITSRSIAPFPSHRRLFFPRSCSERAGRSGD
jgi:hypothetical protein